jgi:arginine decarboxylase
MTWTREDAEKTYHVKKWSDGFFDINEEGNLVIHTNNGKKDVPLINIIDEIRSMNINMPCVIRFHDILRSKVKILNRTFRSVIDEAEYEGRFFGVYPIKVNQMREVVEEVIDAGSKYDYGLEAGSKPELLAVLAYNKNPNSLTILNGYKDSEYLKLAMIGTQLGKKIVIVLEKFSEVAKVIELAKEMNVKPMLGIRSKMSIEGIGRWAHSSGEKAKFGLTIPEILNAVELLEEADMKDCLKLFHFHIGSQISDIKTIKDAINEGGRMYAKLVNIGCKLEYFDAGGGLAIDYDGSRSAGDSSMNYSLEEYVEDIVYGLKQICNLEGVPHPNIVTESGRAITAHHSCVITNVVGTIDSTKAYYPTKKTTGEHILVSNMRALTDEAITLDNYQVAFNEADQLKEDSLNAFRLGILGLDEKAKIETLYWQIMNKIKVILSDVEDIPEDLKVLQEKMAPQYLCNFSVFQSAADLWAIDQILPVVPLTRLNEKPQNLGTIVDITCDSDGKIDQFINADGIGSLVPLHELRDNEDYLIGLFLTGAYQDVMGDMHNLFGRLNEIHVFCDPEDPSGFYIEEVIRGSSCSHVLSTMQYNPEYMDLKIKRMINQRVAHGKIAPRDGFKYSNFYDDCLSNYTYLANENHKPQKEQDIYQNLQ